MNWHERRIRQECVTAAIGVAIAVYELRTLVVIGDIPMDELTAKRVRMISDRVVFTAYRLENRDREERQANG